MGLSIQSQSDHLARIGHNTAEFNSVKSKVATLENTVKAIDNGVNRISDQVNIHQSKIQTQNEICEDARTASGRRNRANSCKGPVIPSKSKAPIRAK